MAVCNLCQLRCSYPIELPPLSSKHHYREKETELTHDEEVMAASLHSYFGDLLKQTGPVRVDDTKFAEAMAALDPECRKLVARYEIR